MFASLLGNLHIRLLVLVVTILVPALGLIFYSTSIEWFEEREHAAVDALGFVRLAASGHEHPLGTTRQLLVTLSLLPQVRKGDVSECRVLLSEVKDKYRFLGWIGITDSEGNILCGSFPEQGQPRTPEGWFQKPIGGGGVSIRSYIPPSGGTGSLGLAQSFASREGTIQAVVVAFLNSDWLNRLAAQCEFPADVDLTLIDTAGTVLARHPDPESWLGTSIAKNPLVLTIFSRKEGVVELPGVDGTLRLNAFIPVGGAAFMIAGIPLSVAYKEAAAAIPRGMTGALFLLLVFVAWYAGDVLILRRIGLVRRQRNLLLPET